MTCILLIDYLNLFFDRENFIFLFFSTYLDFILLFNIISNQEFGCRNIYKITNRNYLLFETLVQLTQLQLTQLPCANHEY